jgi:hypothetical protein
VHLGLQTDTLSPTKKTGTPQGLLQDRLGDIIKFIFQACLEALSSGGCRAQQQAHEPPKACAETTRGDGRYRYRIDPDFKPVRTSIRTYHNMPSEWHRAQERKRRATLLAVGTASGFLPKSYRSSKIEPSMRRPPASADAAILAYTRCQSAWRDELRDRLIATPTAARRDLRATIARHNRERPPSRVHVIANHRQGVRTAGPGGRTVAGLDIVRVQPPSIEERTIDDPTTCAPCTPFHPGCVDLLQRIPGAVIRNATARYSNTRAVLRCRGYEITMTDVLNTFYQLDSTSSGSVSRVEFEQAMVDLGYSTEQAAHIFKVLDVDKDGVLSLADWTHDTVNTLSQLLSFKMIRHRAVGKSPLTAKRPTSSVRRHLLHFALRDGTALCLRGLSRHCWVYSRATHWWLGRSAHANTICTRYLDMRLLQQDVVKVLACMLFHRLVMLL